jgi:hypothetical protein
VRGSISQVEAVFDCETPIAETGRRLRRHRFPKLEEVVGLGLEDRGDGAVAGLETFQAHTAFAQFVGNCFNVGSATSKNAAD